MQQNMSSAVPGQCKPTMLGQVRKGQAEMSDAEQTRQMNLRMSVSPKCCMPMMAVALRFAMGRP